MRHPPFLHVALAVLGVLTALARAEAAADELQLATAEQAREVGLPGGDGQHEIEIAYTVVAPLMDALQSVWPAGTDFPDELLRGACLDMPSLGRAYGTAMALAAFDALEEE